MTKFRTLALAAVCTVTGAGGTMGITALSSSASPGHHHARAAHGVHPHAARLLARAVHGEAVVPQRGGTFANVVYDRGTVKSVSGQDLTLTEGTRTATYKTVTISIPADARVRRAHTRHATLASLQAGDHVRVLQGPKHTLVRAIPARAGSAR